MEKHLQTTVGIYSFRQILGAQFFSDFVHGKIALGLPCAKALQAKCPFHYSWRYLVCAHKSASKELTTNSSFINTYQ